ncbi:hypothetical protein Hanom_Chr02g00165471 [Helianthus anomalus]
MRGYPDTFTHRIKCDGYIYLTVGERFAQSLVYLLYFLSNLRSFFESSKILKVGSGPVLKWDQGLFEQNTRGFRFPPEWDATYPWQGQTAADAPSGYITLFEDNFLQGNFRLPAMEFMTSILHFYGFHISQMSPMGMVRV